MHLPQNCSNFTPPPIWCHHLIISVLQWLVVHSWNGIPALECHWMLGTLSFQPWSTVLDAIIFNLLMETVCIMMQKGTHTDCRLGILEGDQEPPVFGKGKQCAC